jgi:hypothetical protein
MEKLLFLLPLAAVWFLSWMNEIIFNGPPVWWEFPLIITEFCIVISLIIWACAVNF